MKALPWYLLAIFTLIIGFLLWRDSRRSVKMDSMESVLQEKNAEITAFKTQSGRIVTEKPAATITKDDLQEHYPDIVAELKDLKAQVKNVRAVLKATIETKGEGIPIIIRDTVRLPTGLESRDSLFVNDGYLDFRSSISFTENAGYKYTYSDSILFALVRKKKSWLGKKELFGQVRMSNPNSRSLGQTSIMISERPKRFYIGAGVSYNPFTNTFEPSIQAGYKLLSF